MKSLNPLAAWLAGRKLTYAAFARLVNADRARIQRAATGQRRPGLDLALAIERETKGAVPVSVWAERAAEKALGGGRRRRARRAA